MTQEQSRRTLDKVNKFTTVVGEGATFKGSFSGAANFVIHGSVQGDCDIDGTLLVMEEGQVQGNLKSTVMVISGHVEGDITATDKLEMRSSARVKGNIYCDKLAIATGAIHDGEVHMHGGIAITEFDERRRGDDVRTTIV
jgi:cytoskeletal protein CcmA (bactofilin family)